MSVKLIEALREMESNQSIIERLRAICTNPLTLAEYATEDFLLDDDEIQIELEVAKAMGYAPDDIYVYCSDGVTDDEELDRIYNIIHTNSTKSIDDYEIATIDGVTYACFDEMNYTVVYAPRSVRTKKENKRINKIRESSVR